MEHGAEQAGVLCAGSITLDTIVRPFDELRWGTTRLIEEMTRHVGGNGANTARALALLGSPVRLAGVAGNDEAAEFLLHELAESGVDVQNVRRVERPNAASLVLVNARGDRQFLHRLGSSEEAFAGPMQFTPEMTLGVRHFHLASLFVLPHLRRIAPEMLRNAKQAGLSTSLDVNWDARGEWFRVLGPCLPYVDVLFLNEDESRMITGLMITAEAAAFLHDHGAHTVVQKLSQEGCEIYCAGERSTKARCAAFEVDAVDSTGAGDCFAAGFLSAYLRDASLEEAGVYGNAAGALSVSAMGAVTGLLSCADIREWMRRTPRRASSTSK